MRSQGPRWKLLIILIALPILGRIGFRFSPLEEGGFGGAASILAVALVLLLAVIWLLTLSRLPWKHRLIGLLALGILGVGLRFSVRHDGHMGDFFPQLAWIWSPKPGESADDLDFVAADQTATLTTGEPGDFPSFLGPNRNNWVSGNELPPDWHSRTPKELWRRDIGLGWSSFSVAGSLAFTMEQRGNRELTVCYEARTGAPIWAHAENSRFSESMGGDGPRSTPTVHEDGKVYALGAKGILLCLEGRTGDVIWRRDTLSEAGHDNLTWAKSCSPLIVEDTVVITLGNSKDRSLAAYDRLTGEPRWRSGDDQPAYATPVLTSLAGQDQIVSFNASSVSGHHPATGEMLWSQKLKRISSHNATPLIVGPNRFLVGMGYGHGSHLIEIQSNGGQLSPSEIWHSNKFKPKFADMVYRDGHVYGLDEGRLVCLQLEDGQRAWRGSRFKHGQLLGVGDRLLIQAESGEIVIAQASPAKQEIHHRFDALSSKTWNHPVLAGRLLLVRNDREAIAFEYPPQTGT